MLQTTFGSAAPPTFRSWWACSRCSSPGTRILAERREAERALDAILHDRSRGAFSSPARAQGVGMASLLYTISTRRGGKAAWFEDFIVQPEYRGQESARGCSST